MSYSLAKLWLGKPPVNFVVVGGWVNNLCVQVGHVDKWLKQYVGGMTTETFWYAVLQGKMQSSYSKEMRNA
jgi:hypothetical protein